MPDRAALPIGPVADGDLELLLLIRHFELALLELFGRGELNGTTHTCLGQEYIPVAVRPLLTDGDFVFSNHRGHGHYLARFGDPHGLLAEIMGRAGAVCSGVGGSQHILRGCYLSTGVQGESLPVAVGAAMQLKRAATGLLAAAFIGDGTWGEGAVYEALNLAGLWRLPLLVLVEHNGIAQSTPTAAQLSGTIADRARAFGVRHQLVTSIDLAAIRSDLAPLVERVRTEHDPLVVEFRTHRVAPHSKGDDTRDEATRQQALDNDWYPRYARRFPERFGVFDARQQEYVRSVVADVSGRPPSTWKELQCDNG